MLMVVVNGDHYDRTFRAKLNAWYSGGSPEGPYEEKEEVNEEEEEEEEVGIVDECFYALKQGREQIKIEILSKGRVDTPGAAAS
ncbi:hypothetical protein V1477_001946 [Vespula maculifrons]|uniref:Uncharacterized protein n=1 Tax=Vespula maculifrons TaxID=7453 RepID=A0ABD2CZ23_VESMC